MESLWHLGLPWQFMPKLRGVRAGEAEVVVGGEWSAAARAWGERVRRREAIKVVYLNRCMISVLLLV